MSKPTDAVRQIMADRYQYQLQLLDEQRQYWQEVLSVADQHQPIFAAHDEPSPAIKEHIISAQDGLRNCQAKRILIVQNLRDICGIEVE